MRSRIHRFAVRLLALAFLVSWVALAGAQGEQPAGDPHGGGDPHAQSQRYQPPQDQSKKDARLPVGTLAIFLRDAFGRPVPDQDFELLIVHSTVAAGESRESKAGTTDGEGGAIFSDLQIGSGHQYSARVTRDGAVFDTGAMQLDDQSGAIALLHVFEVTKSIDQAQAWSTSEVRVTLKEDVLVVTYRSEYTNPSPYAWLANEQIVFPKGHKALSTPDGMNPKILPNDDGAMMSGTMRPGRHQIAFSFHVPFELDGDQTLPLVMLPNTAQIGIGVSASKTMKLDVSPGFTTARRVHDGTGWWLVSTREIQSLNHPFIPRAQVQIEGLPTRHWGAWVAVAVALLAALLAGAYVFTRRKSTTLADDSYQDLVEARQSLLDEFVALERAQRRGDVGPKTYARIREAMLDALARIVDRMEKARPRDGLPLPSSGGDREHAQHVEKVRPASG